MKHTKTKRRLANLTMLAAILLIAAAGLYAVGNVRGWFSGGENAAKIGNLRGVVRMERSGVAYPLEAETDLRAGDRIACDGGATAVIQVKDGALTLGENAELTILNAGSDTFSAEIESGEIFSSLQDAAISLSFEGESIRLNRSVSLLSVRSGAQSLDLFSGAMDAFRAGQRIDWNGGARSAAQIHLQTLNDFAIEQLRAANSENDLCISNEELDALSAERNAAVQAQLSSETDEGLNCTIAIYCDSILDHMDQLDVAKASFVPGDGVILPPTQLRLEAGDTVFDVLCRVCEAYEIQIEYSWTPLYDSYYIEGIHQLYEFDCGPQSGWMYKVNEWFPNYGCSEYELTGGESIVWCYTCQGLGADVGAE